MTRVRVSVRVSVCPPQPSLRPSVERYLRERPEVAMLLRGLLLPAPPLRRRITRIFSSRTGMEKGFVM